MRFILLCLLLLQTSAFGQDQESILRKRLGAGLKATTSVREQKICSDGSDAVRIDLTLLTRFTNTGKYPIILDKSSGVVGGQKISHTLKKSYLGKYEYNARLEIRFTGGNSRKESDTPSESFVILKPGESYENESETSLSLDYPKQYRHLSATGHFLRLDMFTLLPLANDLDDLRNRWLKYGLLWDGVISQPMPIQFISAGKLSECQ